jgi:hypothetical protein
LLKVLFVLPNPEPEPMNLRPYAALVLVAAATSLATFGCSSDAPTEPPTTHPGSTPQKSGGTDKTGNGGSSGSTAGGDMGGGSEGTGNGDTPDPSRGGTSGTSGGGGTSDKCPEVSGAWKGTATGDISGALTAKVNGSITLQVNGTGTTLQVADSSEMDVMIESALGKLPFKQNLTGTVECGVLKSALMANVAGTAVTGTATCTFTATGCSGTWQGMSDDGKATAKGTFTVAR